MANQETKAKYNFEYNKANEKDLAKKRKVYKLKNREEIAHKRKIYNKKNKELFRRKQRKYREMIRKKQRMSWSDTALKELLQDKPKYTETVRKKDRKRVPMIIKWIDTEQLVDLIVFFKERNYPGFQDVEIDYAFMPACCKLETQPTKPKFTG